MAAPSLDPPMFSLQLIFNFGFADQHHGNVVANGIDAAALAAFQPLAAFGQIHLCFAKGADENLQKLRIHSHSADVTTGLY